MKWFNKVALSSALALSAFAGASAYDNCCPPPACNPCGGWCDNFSFNAAWLYWKTSGDEFDYAFEKASYLTQDGTIIVDYERAHDVKTDWNDGFRIGFGFDVPCSGWGVNVNWTHYDSESSSHTLVDGPDVDVTSNPPEVISVSLPAIDGFTTELGFDDEAYFRGKVNFQYNVIDLELGKWLCCCDSALIFRPHIGFRFADIQEKFRSSVELKGATVTLNGTQGIQTASFSNKNDFKGWGVRVGLDTDLHLCSGWSLIGRGAASAIWGRTHLKNHLFYFNEFEDEQLITSSKDSYIKEDYRQVRFITDLSFGVRYETCLCGCYPVNVELLWEHHYLFGQHRFWVDDVAGARNLATTSWKKNGDVALQGLTLSFGVDF